MIVIKHSAAGSIFSGTYKIRIFWDGQTNFKNHLFQDLLNSGYYFYRNNQNQELTSKLGVVQKYYKNTLNLHFEARTILCGRSEQNEKLPKNGNLYAKKN